MPGAVAFAIACRESVLVEFVNLQPFGLAMGFGKSLAERVAPVAPGLGEPVLDRFQIEIDRPARRGGDDELQSRMSLVGDLEVDHRDPGAELLLDDFPHDSTQLRGVAFARHVDQAGDEPVEGVAPDEQRNFPAAADLQDAERGPQQVVVGILEQIAAGQRLEDLQQRHPVMAVRREARARDHRRRLAGEHGDVREALSMDQRREQAQEDADAGDPAPRGIFLDHHRVEMDRPVDRRAAVRLGDRERAGILAIGRDLGQNRAVPPAGQHAARRIAQDPEPGRPGPLQPDRPAPPGEVVFAVTDEGEAAVVEPAEKRPRLGDFGSGGPRRVAFQILGGLGEPPLHRGQVLDRGADIDKNRFQPAAQAFEGIGPAQLGDLEMHHRLGSRAAGPAELFQPSRLVPLDLHDRVDDQMDRKVLPVDLRGHRIDEKRHVVVDDVDRGVRRGPSVRPDAGVEDPDVRLAALAGPQQLPDRHGAAQGPAVVRREIGFRHVLIELRDEPRGLGAAALAPPRPGRKPLNDPGFIRGLDRHAPALARFDGRQPATGGRSGAGAIRTPIPSRRRLPCNISRRRDGTPCSPSGWRMRATPRSI